MAAPGESFPFQFAQAVLQARQQLVQRDAELTEMRQSRAVTAALEEQRLRQQSMQASQSNALGQQQIDMHMSVAKMTAEAQGKRDELMTAHYLAQQKDQQDKEYQSKLGVLGKQPVYFGKGEVIPSLDAIPKIKDAAGKEVPVYQLGRMDTPGGGAMLFPLTSEFTQDNYDKMHAALVSTQVKTLATQMGAQLAAAREARIREIMNHSDAPSPAVFAAAQKAVTETQNRVSTLSQTKLLLAGSNATGLENIDPYAHLAPSEQTNYEHNQAIVNKGYDALMGASKPGGGQPPPSSPTGTSPMDMFRKLQALPINLPTPEIPAKALIGHAVDAMIKMPDNPDPNAPPYIFGKQTVQKGYVRGTVTQMFKPDGSLGSTQLRSLGGTLIQDIPAQVAPAAAAPTIGAPAPAAPGEPSTAPQNPSAQIPQASAGPAPTVAPALFDQLEEATKAFDKDRSKENRARLEALLRQMGQ